jgi:F-type H+-transporting ATPase subunit alpha
MNLSKESIGAVLLNNVWDVSEGSTVRNTGTVVQVPVGDALLGRVVSPLGVPMDGKGKVFADKYRTIEAEAPHIFDRQGVKKPLETGIISIDSMVPIGKGQRELIIGDRQTGKTAIAIDTILNQKGKNVYCVYVAIGQKASTIASILKTLEDEGALEYTIVVASTGSDAPSMQYIAPYAGCAIAEEFMYSGKDALIVYDDLSKHAVAYRTMSLLLRRPPGREAYPGDVFYLHSRLLERAARLNDAHGGGSMTALPIIETMAGDISAYIPTNVISITDGQIFLESELFNAGIRPAVNVGLSVSRVGGSAQIKAMRKVAGRLRLDLAQYRELAVFAQFASDLDKNTRETLDQGARLTESLKQPQYSPYSMASQVILLYVAINKYLVKLPFNHVSEFNRRYLDYVDTNYPEVRLEIDKTGDLSEESISSLRKAAEAFVPIYCQQNAIKLETEEED